MFIRIGWDGEVGLVEKNDGVGFVISGVDGDGCSDWYRVSYHINLVNRFCFNLKK
jgi:hypothetical protein